MKKTLSLARYPCRCAYLWQVIGLPHRTMGVVFLIAVAAPFLTGCAVIRLDINAVDFHERAGNVEVGKTTSDELRTMIGSPPQSVLFTDDDETVWIYSFGQAKTAGLTLIVFNTLKTNMGLDGGLFLIDKDGIVKKKIVSTNSQDLPWEWWPLDEDDDS